MTLLLLILLAYATLTAALLALPVSGGKTGQETEWDDPIPEMYRPAWLARYLPTVQPAEACR